MFRILPGSPAHRATRPRRLGARAVIATCAAAAVLGTGGVALASNSAKHPTTATTSTIKACYQGGTSPAALKHVASSASCPKGYTSLTWNKVGPQGPVGAQGARGAQGPQGPAGLATGTSGSSDSAVTLDNPEYYQVVLSAAAVTTSGTYYVNASVMLDIAQGDTVACVLGLSDGDQQLPYADVGPVANDSFETLPLTDTISLAVGDQLAVWCSDYTANSGTHFSDGAITATLINSATSGVKQGKAEHTVKLPTLPRR